MTTLMTGDTGANGEDRLRVICAHRGIDANNLVT